MNRGLKKGAEGPILRDWSVVLTGTFLILLPAMVNGFPFVYPDTGTYLASAFRGEVPVDRPAWYGLFMRIGSLGGNTFWGIITAQAFLCSLYIFRTVAMLVPMRRHRASLIILAVLSTVSSLGWYAGQLMPDIFTGIGLLALCQMFLGRGKRLVRAADTALAVFCCWVHLSNLLILPVSGAILLLSARQRVPAPSPLRWAALIGYTALAWGGLATANRLVDREFYISRGSQAFLVARMLDTGMLRAWMEEHCPEGGYRICAYMDRMPPSGGHLLWHDSISPMHLEGGWLATRPEYQRIVRSTLTEPRFLLWHITAGVKSASDLLTRGTICGALVNKEYRSSKSPPYFMIEGTIRSGLEPYLASLQNGGRGELSMVWPDLVYGALMLFSIAVALVLILHSRKVHEFPSDRALLLFVCGALLIDALVCASLSAVEDRYLSRVTWLLPLMVSIVLMRRWHTSGRTTIQDGPPATGTR